MAADVTAETANSAPTQRVLVTGASGFIGAALVKALAPAFRVRASYRSLAQTQAGDVVAVGDLSGETDWARTLADVEVVVHLAGPAHSRHSPDVLQRTIVDATARLAEQAAEAGVKRFVFVSSIHACAKRSQGTLLDETTTPNPTDGYGAAKLAAERVVLAHAQLNPIVLRPPLIYDAQAKGNFARLLRLLDTPWPLPLAGMRNKRSLMSLASFNAAIAAVLSAPAGAGVFHVCDSPAVSTSELAALLRRGMGRSPRLFKAPGLSAIAPPALTESLEIDARKFRSAFNYAGENTHDALVACGKEWARR